MYFNRKLALPLHSSLQWPIEIPIITLNISVNDDLTNYNSFAARQSNIRQLFTIAPAILKGWLIAISFLFFFSF